MPSTLLYVVWQDLVGLTEEAMVAEVLLLPSERTVDSCRMAGLLKHQ